MDIIVDRALNYGFWVFGGYVRDVVVCGQTKYNDIDIGCSWDQMNLLSKFIGDAKILDDTLERTGRTRHIVYPFVRRIIKLESIDIIVFSSFQDFLNQPLDVSCNLFYLLQGRLYTRGKRDYTELTKQRKFVTFEYISEGRKRKLLDNGWSEAFGSV